MFKTNNETEKLTCVISVEWLDILLFKDISYEGVRENTPSVLSYQVESAMFDRPLKGTLRF